MSEYRLMVGDCVERLRELQDSSVDAVVTDPPYGLSKQPDMAKVMRHWLNGDDYKHKGAGFMGKSWDSFVPGPSVWRECFRVLKPGGHLLSFFGSRTYDIGALAIRLAGFEVRDQIIWVYGSGFPKSLDVSKAIDKCNGEPNRLLKFTRWMRTTNLRPKQVSNLLRSAGVISENGTIAAHFFAKTQSGQPAIPTAALWEVLRPHCGHVPKWVDQLVDRIEAEREVVGKYQTDMGGLGGQRLGQSGGNITTASTDAAQQWQGWGTALKPAHEPIVMARKPISTTVAANVLEHGTGAINVDGCRIDASAKDVASAAVPNRSNLNYCEQNGEGRAHGLHDMSKGRWPANFIIDGSNDATQGLGEASRYFYCAKASKRDRDEGCEAFQKKEKHTRNSYGDQSGYKCSDGANRKGNKGTSVACNHHPTVKPTELMRYLVRMVTPPNGTVLDPFTGSGSTGKACMIEGFHFVGCELSNEYAEIAKARMEHAKNLKPQPKPQSELFDD